MLTLILVGLIPMLFVFAMETWLLFYMSNYYREREKFYRQENKILIRENRRMWYELHGHILPTPPEEVEDEM